MEMECSEVFYNEFSNKPRRSHSDLFLYTIYGVELAIQENSVGEILYEFRFLMGEEYLWRRLGEIQGSSLWFCWLQGPRVNFQ